MKEWLAEHRINYRGIPEKDELIVLVKTNWIEPDSTLKQQADMTTSYVDELVKYLESCKYYFIGHVDKSGSVDPL